MSDHARWCPFAEGYNGPFMPELQPDVPWDGVTCYCNDDEQSELYYDAIERFR